MASSIIRGRSVIATVALCAFFPVALSGCFGRFELVRKVYSFNKEVSSDKWIQWLAFLGMVIIPIYGIASLVDAIVANSLEFRTGDNPIVGEIERTFQGENGDVAAVTYRMDGSMELRITKRDGTRHFLRLLREADSILAVDAAGSRIARVGDLDGRPALLPD